MHTSPRLTLLLASLPWLTLPVNLHSQCCGGSADKRDLVAGEGAFGPPGSVREFTVVYKGNTTATLQIGQETVTLEPTGNGGGDFVTKRMDLREIGGSGLPSSGETLPMTLANADGTTEVNVKETTGGEGSPKKTCPACEVKVPNDSGGWSWMPIEDPIQLKLAALFFEVRCVLPPKDPQQNETSPNTDRSTPSIGNSQGGGGPESGEGGSSQGAALESALSAGLVPPPQGGGYTLSTPGLRCDFSLGDSVDGRGRAGVIAPDPSPSGLDPVFGVGYWVRGITVDGGGSPSVTVHSDSIYYHLKAVAKEGATFVFQPSSMILEVASYTTASSGAGDAMPPLGAVPVRLTRITKLGSGDAPYNLIGYTVATERNGVPVDTKTYSFGDVEGIPNGAGGFYAGAKWKRVTQDAGNSWQTIEEWATSLDQVSQGQRIQTYVRRLVDTSAGGVSILAADIQETRRWFNWGEEVVSRTVKNWDADGTARHETTTWDWWDFGEEDEDGFLPDDPNHGKIQRVIYPDGSWESHVIWQSSPSSTVIQEFTIRPWKNRPPPGVETDPGTLLDETVNLGDPNEATWCDVTATTHWRDPATGPDLDPNASPDTWKRAGRTERLIGGTVVSRSESADYGIWDWTKDYADGATWFATVTERHPASVDPLLRHRPISVTRLKQNVTPAIALTDYISRTTYGYTTGSSTTFGDPSWYVTSGSFHSLDPLQIVDVTELGNVSPPLVTRTITDLASQRVIERETFVSSGGLTRIRDERWVHDSRGRLLERWEDGRIVETSSYPDDYTRIHTDSRGVTRKRGWDGMHRLKEEWIMGVAALTEIPPGTTSPSTVALAQNDVKMAYSYSPRVNGATTLTGYKLTSVTEAPGEEDWARVSTEEIDAAGRTVKSTDPLQIETKMLYALTANMTTGVPVTVTTPGVSVLTISHRDGRTYSTTATPADAIIPEYRDTTVAAWAMTEYSSQYAANLGQNDPVNGLVKAVTDGLGREVSTRRPVSITPAGALVYFTSSASYDTSGRLLSRLLPGTPTNADYHEVRQHYQPLPADAPISYRGAADTLTPGAGVEIPAANRSKIEYSRVLSGGRWWDVAKQYTDMAATTPANWQLTSETQTALGPFPLPTTGSWCLNAWTKVISSGTTVEESEFSDLSTRRVMRIRSRNASAMEISIYYNGLLANYSPQGGGGRLVSHSPLRERTTQVSRDNDIWPFVTLFPETGQVSKLTNANNIDVETYTYWDQATYRAGQLKSKATTASVAGTTYYDYNPRGQLIRQWGGGEYPAEYEYDAEGRMKYLRTYRDYANGIAWTSSNLYTSWPAAANADQTEWLYVNGFSQPYAKKYAGVAQQLTYSFHGNGSVATRIWQRGITTTYGYDTYARMGSVTYSDGTAGSTFTYNAGGRTLTHARGGQTNTLAWRADGQQDTDTISGGGLGGFLIDRDYDTFGRWNKLNVKLSGTAYTPEVTHTYAAGDRLATISATSGGSVKTATYASPEFPAVRCASYTVAGTGVLTASRNRDAAGRLYYLGYLSPSVILQSFTHTYNPDNGLKDVQREDTAKWNYAYNTKGEVIDAKKSLPSNPTTYYNGTVAQYDYDHAGNRKTAKESGGGTFGSGGLTWPLLTTGYGQANALNQYTSVTNTSQQFDVTGQRNAGATITVGATSINPAVTLGTGEYQPSGGTYFAKRITHNNGTSGLYENVTVTKTLPTPAETLENGTEYVPPPTATPNFDTDGNLTFDGRWTYTWDGENRLASMSCPGTLASASPAVSGKRLTFIYDALSRRTGKKVETQAPSVTLPNTNPWVFSTAEGYLYDGWSMILTVELNSSGAPVRRTASYLWGPDMDSRSSARADWQKAGGVGGLVMVLGNATGLTAPNPAMYDYAPLMDRMGNVTAYRKLIGTATVTQKSLTANVATVTTSAAHSFTPGQTVAVALTPTDAVFNGTWTISAVPTATTFTFARTNANIAPTSTGGTAHQGTSLAAIFEYDAFGRELRASGPAADFLPFRFCTKFTDKETALVYYGYRYYHSGWGRWINRDPIEEEGGMNLFSMAANALSNNLDSLGCSYRPGWPKNCDDFLNVDILGSIDRIYKDYAAYKTHGRLANKSDEWYANKYGTKSPTTPQQRRNQENEIAGNYLKLFNDNCKNAKDALKLLKDCFKDCVPLGYLLSLQNSLEAVLSKCDDPSGNHTKIAPAGTPPSGLSPAEQLADDISRSAEKDEEEITSDYDPHSNSDIGSLPPPPLRVPDPLFKRVYPPGVRYPIRRIPIRK